MITRRSHRRRRDSPEDPYRRAVGLIACNFVEASTPRRERERNPVVATGREIHLGTRRVPHGCHKASPSQPTRVSHWDVPGRPGDVDAGASDLLEQLTGRSALRAAPALRAAALARSLSEQCQAQIAQPCHSHVVPLTSSWQGKIRRADRGRSHSRD
jgi:hypothetical protein